MCYPFSHKHHRWQLVFPWSYRVDHLSEENYAVVAHHLPGVSSWAVPAASAAHSPTSMTLPAETGLSLQGRCTSLLSTVSYLLHRWSPLFCLKGKTRWNYWTPTQARWLLHSALITLLSYASLTTTTISPPETNTPKNLLSTPFTFSSFLRRNGPNVLALHMET